MNSRHVFVVAMVVTLFAWWADSASAQGREPRTKRTVVDPAAVSPAAVTPTSQTVARAKADLTCRMDVWMLNGKNGWPVKKIADKESFSAYGTEKYLEGSRGWFRAILTVENKGVGGAYGTAAKLHYAEQATGLGPSPNTQTDTSLKSWSDLDLVAGASQQLSPAHDFYLRTNDTGSPAVYNVSVWGTVDQEYPGDVAETNEQNNTCLSQFTVEIMKNPHH